MKRNKYCSDVIVHPNPDRPIPYCTPYYVFDWDKTFLQDDTYSGLVVTMTSADGPYTINDEYNLNIYDNENDISDRVKYICGLVLPSTKDNEDEEVRIDIDYYYILGLQNKRYTATFNDIKAAYRKTVLLLHPDRRSSDSDIHLEHSQFVFVTKAYQVLSNSEERFAYDCVDPLMNDNIPTVSTNEELIKTYDSNPFLFYQVFGRAFYKFAKWSSIQPVPLLGDSTTLKTHIEIFYAFWKNFQSIRKFTHLDKEKVVDGENREERRWIEKENKKARKMHEKKHADKIGKLVALAIELDPRIRYYRRLKQEQIENKKNTNQKSSKTTAQPQKTTTTNTESTNSSVNIKETLQVRQAVTELVVKNEKKSLFDEKILNMIKIMSLDHMKQLNNMLRSDTLSKERIESEPFLNTYHNLIKEKESAQKQTNTEYSWSNFQLKKLKEALTQYPSGTQNRFKLVAMYINKMCLNSKDVEQRHSRVDEHIVTAKIEQLRNAKKQANKEQQQQQQQEQNRAQTWTNDEHALFISLLKTYPKNHANRWVEMSKHFDNKTAQQCNERYLMYLQLLKNRKKKMVESPVSRGKCLSTTARIKKAMQSDETVGKLTSAVPKIMLKSLEIMLEKFCAECMDKQLQQNSKTITIDIMKEVVNEDECYDFFRKTMSEVQAKEKPVGKRKAPRKSGDAGSVNSSKRPSRSVEHFENFEQIESFEHIEQPVECKERDEQEVVGMEFAEENSDFS